MKRGLWRASATFAIAAEIAPDFLAPVSGDGFLRPGVARACKLNAIAMRCWHEDAKRLSPEGVAARAEGIARSSTKSTGPSKYRRSLIGTTFGRSVMRLS